MIDLNALMQDISALTLFTVAALAGLVVGMAPSSYPLMLVATALTTARTIETGTRHGGSWRLAVGFALGIASVDAILGSLFGLFGFAVMRILAHYLAFAYLLLALILVVAALALLRIIHVVIPTLAPSSKPTRGFIGSYLLGLPFGLSTCPACTPLLFPVAAAATATADPFLGAVLMGTFGLTRGIPIVAAATMAVRLANLRSTGRFTLWAERIGAALMLATSLYFLYEAALYAGLLAP